MLFHLLKKELLEVIRDRRLMVTIFIIAPLVPLCAVLLVSFIERASDEAPQNDLRIGIYHAHLTPGLVDYLSEQGITVSSLTSTDFTAAFEREKLSLIIEVASHPEEGGFRYSHLTVHYPAANKRASTDTRDIARMLEEYKHQWVLSMFRSMELDPALLEPVKIDYRNTSSSTLTGMLIFLFAFYLFFSAYSKTTSFVSYSLIGERERNTLEPLVMAIPNPYMVSSHFAIFAT